MLPTVENSHLSRMKWHLIQETMSASILARPEPSIYYIAVELRTGLIKIRKADKT